MTISQPFEYVPWPPGEPEDWNNLKKSEIIDIIEHHYLTKERMSVESKRLGLGRLSFDLGFDPNYMILSPRRAASDRPKWEPQKQSRLIESFLGNFPVPFLLLFKRNERSYDVIDGWQRLTAIREFYENKLVLTGLELWPELNGMRYKDVPSHAKITLRTRRIKAVIILRRENHSEEYVRQLRKIVFQRLATEAVPLEKQEIRNGLYQGLLNDLLLKLSKLDLFRQAWNLPFYSEQEESGNRKAEIFKIPFFEQMQEVEVVLRFFALRHLEYYQSELPSFLDLYMRRSLNFTQDDCSFLEALYVRTLNLAAAIFGELIFRPYLPDQHSWSSEPNPEFYDAVMIGLAGLLDQAETLIERREQVIAATINLFITHKLETFTGKDNSKADIETRITLFSAMLHAALD